MSSPLLHLVPPPAPRWPSSQRSPEHRLFLSLLLFASFFVALPCLALPAKLGDLDEDGVPTVHDIAKLAAHFEGTHPLSPEVALFADINQDGALNEADQEALANEILLLTTPRDLPLAAIRDVSPATGEVDVAVTRETIVQFTLPLSPLTSIDTNRFHADFGGRKILSRVDIAADRKKATLFYLEQLPSNARIIVTFDGTGLNDLLERAIDADGDGQPGGVFTTEFETISTEPVPETGVTGFVYASERGTGGGEVPLAGVTITVDGAEESMRAVTAADGSFTLTPCPSGTFFVHIDGRTSPASNYPNGDYYPTVGKKWFAVPGRLDNPAGDLDDTPNGGGTGVIYLPCICDGTLKTVSLVQETVITFPPSVLAANPALAGTEIRVPANSLFADDGTRGGKVGIAPVAPDRIPSPLPPGLNPPIVFTVQSDGATNFDQPVPVCLPNLPDPVTGKKLDPGAKSALFSFNHDIGEWEIAGSMTVREDGNCVTTDAGVGVRQPGWHVSQPGAIVEGQIKASCGDLGNAAFSVIEKTLDKFATAISLQILGKTFKAVTPAINGYSRYKAFKSCLMSEQDLAGSARCIKATVSATGLAPELSAIKKGFGPFKGIADAIILLDDLEMDIQRFKDAMAHCRGRWNGTSQLAQFGIDIANINGLRKKVSATADQAIEDIADAETAIDSFTSMDDFSAITAAALDELIAVISKAYASSELAATLIFQLTAAADQASAAGNALVQSVQMSVSELAATFPPSCGEGSLVASVDYPEIVLQLPPASTSSHFRFIVPPYSFVNIKVGNAECQTAARVVARAGGPGSITNVGNIPESEVARIDTDQDGLFDELESIFGLDPILSDTNGDGIADLQQLLSTGLASAGAALTGATAQTKVAAAATDISSSSRTLAVACGSEGTAFLATQGIAAPVMRTRIPTPNWAAVVGVGANAALIAESGAGFRCVSLDDRLNVTAMTLLPMAGRADSAVAVGGIGYGGTSNGTIVELDLASGGILRQLETGAGGVEDLAVQGDWLFARKPDRLLAIQLSGVPMTVAGQLVLSTGTTPSAGRLRIALAEGRVYCTRVNGVQIVDISSLPAMTLAGTVTGPGDNWRHFLPNGNVGLLAGKVQVTNNWLVRLPIPLSLFVIPPAGNTVNIGPSFTMPGFARAVALNRGIGYVACDNGSLAVVNYLDFDRQRQSPGIVLSSSVDLALPAPEVIEGSVMRLSASVTDDIQVGNVEFFVDGLLVFDDGAYPFEHRFLAPRRSLTRTTFKIRARAVDTGGNAAWSQEYEIRMLPDAKPPVVRSLVPAHGTMNRTVANVFVRFNELMDPLTFTATALSLTEAGADGTFGTADDAAVPYVPFYSDGETPLRLAPTNAPLPPGLYRVVAGPPAADATGNLMAAAAESIFRVYSLIDTDNDGLPDDWEAMLGTNTAVTDSNGNGIADGLEDRDNDGTPDGVEIFRLAQDPRVADANGNGIVDGNDDSDSDGMRDGLEAIAGTDFLSPDTDGDGLDDGTEYAAGMNALDPSNVLVLSTQSANLAAINAEREITPLLPTPIEGPPTSVVNALPEMTPIIPTPVQSGTTSFKNTSP